MSDLRRFLIHSGIVQGSIATLKNWEELLDGCWQESAGKRITHAPVLRFRDGLQIQMVPGGYGGFYILFPEIFLRECYLPTHDFAIRSGFTVLDIGANMGFFSLWALQAARDIRIIGVEPVTDYVEAYRKNVELNGFTNAKVIEAAIAGDSNGEISVEIWYTASGEPKVTTTVPENAPRKTNSAAKISMRDLYQQEGVQRCDLLKVDIEGAEYDAFLNAPAEVWERTDRIVMELHEVSNHQPAELVDLLEANGFFVDANEQATMLWAIKPHLKSR